MKIISSILILGLASWSFSSSTDKSDGNLVVNKFAKNQKLSPEKLGTLIVGGVAANKNEFPWLVNLRLDGGFCGGTLIGMDLVLTAAHCFYKPYSNELVSPNSIQVIAGDHFLSRNDGSEQRSRVSEYMIHARYSRFTLVNDIALIRLKTNFTSTPAVRSISLSDSNSTGTYGIAAGWGTTRELGLVSEVLNKVTVPIVSDLTCISQLFNPDGQFCAGEFSRDSCQGDSGGPFICDNTPDKICGIVSYGAGCGRANKPGVYTKVSAYSQWIDQNRLRFNYNP